MEFNPFTRGVGSAPSRALRHAPGHTRSRAHFWIGIAMVAGLFAGLGHAQPRDTLTLARAQSLLRQHPALSALTQEIEARHRLVAQAGALPNPSLSVEAENFAGTGPLSGVRELETTARLEQTFELGGKRALRRGQAQAEAGLAESERASKSLELSVELQATFSEALRLQERLRILDLDTSFLREAVEVAHRRSQAGGGGVAEEGKLRLSFSRARMETARTRAQLEVAFHRLALLLSLPAPDFKAVRQPAAVELPEWTAVVESLEQHPNLQRWKAERRLREISRLSARAQNTPDLGFNAGLRRLNAAGGDWALVGGVSVPLPVWNRNKSAVASSESRVVGGEHASEAARRELTDEAFGLWSGLRIKAQELERLRGELLPEAARVRDATRAAYAQGRFGVLELLDGQKTWLELNEHFIAQSAEYRLEAAKLAALMGASNL